MERPAIKRISSNLFPTITSQTLLLNSLLSTKLRSPLRRKIAKKVPSDNLALAKNFKKIKELAILQLISKFPIQDLREVTL